MKLRKIAALTMSVVMAASVFTGCGNKTEDGNVKVVTIWGSGADVKVAKKAAEDYNATIGKEKGIKIDYQVKEGDVHSQLSIALQSGDAPDIFEHNKLKEDVEKGYLAPLTAFEGGDKIIEESIANGGIMREDENMVDGVVYAVSDYVLTYGLVYNKEMFKAAGIVDENGEAKAPETWAEFRETAKKLTDKSKKQYGVIFPMKWSAWYLYELEFNSQASNGFLNFDPETMQYDYSKMNDILQTIVDIRDDGSCFPGPEGVDNDPARARFAEGNIGMKLSVSWDAGVFDEQFVPGFEWGVAPIPVLDKDKKYPQYMQINNTGYINAKVLDTDREDAVWEVWKYWYGAEMDDLLYREGIKIPINLANVKNMETDIPGWAEFAELRNISCVTPYRLSTLTTGEKTLKEYFINDVWNGNMTVEEATAAFTKSANAGIETYYSQSKSKDIEKDKELVKKEVVTLR